MSPQSEFVHVGNPSSIMTSVELHLPHISWLVVFSYTHSMGESVDSLSKISQSFDLSSEDKFVFFFFVMDLLIFDSCLNSKIDFLLCEFALRINQFYYAFGTGKSPFCKVQRCIKCRRILEYGRT